jgi:hypothetical protein
MFDVPVLLEYTIDVNNNFLKNSKALQNHGKM